MYPYEMSSGDPTQLLQTIQSHSFAIPKIRTRGVHIFFLYCWSSVTDFNWVERPHVLWGYKLTNLNQSYRDMYAFFKFEFKSRFSQDPFVRLILSVSFDLCLFFLKLYENKLIIVLSGVVGEKYGSAVKSHLHSAEIQKL